MRRACSRTGTLVCSWDGAPAWTEIAHVETSTTGILAVTNTGEIRTHFFRASDDPGIQLNGKAVEIASSGTHHVILLEDGPRAGLRPERRRTAERERLAVIIRERTRRGGFFL